MSGSMLYDFNTQTSIDKIYDVCVVGTGPAGITMARKLSLAGQKVLLLEAGGLTIPSNHRIFMSVR